MKNNNFYKISKTGNSVAEEVSTPKDKEDYTDLDEQRDREDAS